jgi:hypothetical protein
VGWTRAARYYAEPLRLGFTSPIRSAHPADAGHLDITCKEFDEVGAEIGRAGGGLEVA